MYLQLVNKASVQAPDYQTYLNETEFKILQLCLEKPINRQDILSEFKHKTMSGNIKQALKSLRELGLIDLTIEDKPNSKNQKYKNTKNGKQVLSQNV